MKKVFLEKNIVIIGVKNFKYETKNVDYYIQLPDKKRIYAFTRKYTDNTYRICKSGIGVNALMTLRSRDTGIMGLVKNTRLMVPYLAEEYDLTLA